MPKKILIVDDDPDMVQSVTMILESKNYEVAAAYGGIEGLQKATSENPDLIVLDVMMPGLDGFETCRRLKAAEATRDIAVIFMTALDEHIYFSKEASTGGASFGGGGCGCC